MGQANCYEYHQLRNDSSHRALHRRLETCFCGSDRGIFYMSNEFYYAIHRKKALPLPLAQRFWMQCKLNLYSYQRLLYELGGRGGGGG